MLREEIRAFRNATPRDLRKFGLVVGGVFVLLALLFALPKWHKDWHWWFLVPGVPLIALGAIAPRSLKWIYVGWMMLAVVLGTVVSTVLLTGLFYFLVTPIGLIARMAGKDFLSRRLLKDAPSYWIPRDAAKPKQKHEHEQQF